MIFKKVSDPSCSVVYKLFHINPTSNSTILLVMQIAAEPPCVRVSTKQLLQLPLQLHPPVKNRKGLIQQESNQVGKSLPVVELI